MIVIGKKIINFTLLSIDNFSFFFYRNSFTTTPKIQRQLMMQEEYCFICQCEACTNNYPIFKQLKIKDKKIHKLAKKYKFELFKVENSSFNSIEKCFEISETIEKNFNQSFPSQEIVLFQETLLQCFYHMTKPKLHFA